MKKSLQKYLLSLLGVFILLGAFASASLLSIPNSISAAFPDIDTNYSIVNFDVQNGFNGIFLWRDNGTGYTQDITLGSATITGCTQQLRGLYYNNQRGARLWPLDNDTLTTMQGIDNSYSGLQLTGGLYTHCTNVPSDNVYGSLGHIRGGHTYRIVGGVDYDFTGKQWLPTFSGSFIKGGSLATGRLFDSQGAIGEFAGSTGTVVIVTPPAPPICGNDIVESGEQCDGTTNCTSSCTFKTTTSSWRSNPEDYCPDGDFSSSYYDDECGEELLHLSAPVGKACTYTDEDYLGKGPFTDTINHRGFPYTEVMRVSCLHRGRGTNKGLWTYEPNNSITRAEVLKTVVKILGVAFDDFTVNDEDKVFNGTIPFADLSADNWFAHYANYAYTKGLTAGLFTSDADGKKLLKSDQVMTRYEAIKVMMLAYNMIEKSTISLSGSSVMGDVIDKNNPYYSYIRQAESLGFISGVPQKNGGYNFEGQNNITRAEFAKIVGVPFSDQLFDMEEVVLQSNLYKIIVKAIAKTQSDKKEFVANIFKSLASIKDADFIKSFKVQKKLFLDTLREVVLEPLMDQ